MALYTPRSEAEAAQLIADLALTRTPLSIQGGATRAGIGRPIQTAATLSTRMLSGITLHEPAELVIAALAGTPVAEIEAALAEKGQMLPFEPIDHRAVFGTTGEPSIGAVAAGNHSGPRRISAGAARDAMIGLRLVNGRGEVVKSGGRVMKNVTGLDLVKLAAGSWGTLGLFTEITFRVLPVPETALTLLWRGLDDRRAVTLLTQALGSPFEPSGAAHLPAGIGGAEARTVIRLEGFRASLDYRIGELRRLLAAFGPAHRLEAEETAALWRGLRDAVPLAEPRDAALWRLSTAPSRGPDLVARIAAAVPSARAFYDWGGGLVWLALPAGDDAAAPIVRAAIAAAGGHATLIRAPREIRAGVEVFQPLGPLGKITAGIKASFDPERIFEPGRMYAGI